MRFRDAPLGAGHLGGVAGTEAIADSYGGGTTSEHWDGDSVLFEQGTLSGGGAIQDVQIGKLAVAYGGPGDWSVVVEDRDFSGGVVARHGNPGGSSWADLRGFHLASNVKGGLGPITYPGGSSQIDGVNPPPLSPDREDGYGDGYGNVFQGVRVYDPTMAQWTAPDAYAGDVHDPMSQKPFMWNGNNPLDFEDPSGYYDYLNGTHDQKQAYDDYAKATDKKVVAAMKGLDKKSSEYQILSSMHEDLQKGKGDMHISFGDPGEGENAMTTLTGTPSGGTMHLSGASSTVVGPNFASASGAEKMSTIATEAALYELGSSRAGGSLRAKAGDAAYQDFVKPGCGSKCGDAHLDNLTNQYVAVPIGVPRDQ